MNMITLCGDGDVSLALPLPNNLSDDSSSRYVPSICANQVVCRFPNANCATLVSRPNPISQSTTSPRTRLRTQKPQFQGVHDKEKTTKDNPTISVSVSAAYLFASVLTNKYSLSSDGDAFAAGGIGLRCSGDCVLWLVCVVCLGLIDASFALEEAALLDRAASLDAGDGAMVLGNASSGAVHRGGEVGDVFGHGVLRADGTGVNAVALSGLGHGIVARIEVLAVLEMLGEVVGAGGQLAVEAEETLLLGGE